MKVKIFFLISSFLSIMVQTAFMLTLLIFFTSCNQHVDTNQSIIKLKNASGVVLLNQWHVVGPFSSNGKTDLLNIDYLEQFGVSEKKISFLEFTGIQSYNVGADSIFHEPVFVSTVWKTGNTIADVKKFFSINDDNYRGTAYFGVLIESPREIHTFLHYSSSTSDKIWLNNEIIATADHEKRNASYQQFIPVKLKKGGNFLLIKTSQNRNAWNIYARLEPFSQNALKRQLGLRNQSVMQDHIFNGDSIKLNRQTPSYNGVITISDFHGNQIIKDSVSQNHRWTYNFTTYPNGIYRAQYTVKNFTVSHDFYKGDLHDTIQNIIKEIRLLEQTDENRKNIEALIYRYNFLTTNTYPTNKRFISHFIQLYNIYVHLLEGKNPFHHTPGWHVRTYVSEIDNSLQYYILHVPSHYTQDSVMACAIISPVILGARLPYLESFRLDNIFLINHLQSLAEKHNIIIVQPGSRRHLHGNRNTIEEAEMFMILNDVEKDYNIDRRRMYLLGACVGGQDALKIATRFPDIFAAMGLIAPEIIYPNECKNSAITYIKNIKNIPVYVTHSQIDTQISVERSRLLYSIAKKVGFKEFVYEELPHEFPLFYSDNFFDEALAFCVRFTLNESPSQIDFTTNSMLYNKSFWITINELSESNNGVLNAKMRRNNTLVINREHIYSYTIDLKKLPYNQRRKLKIIENGDVIFNEVTKGENLVIGENKEGLRKTNTVAGPLSHLFSQPFIIVKGTMGSESENKIIDSIANKLNNLWYDRYFTFCITKNDTEITPDDITSSNLLLLGNYNSNFILKELNGMLPLVVSEDAVHIFDEKISGTNLSFYMIFPNPINNERYVGIIGYNDYRKFSLGAEVESLDDISNYGWFDFKVWDEMQRVRLSGNFNSRWMKSASE